jgi:hypothetical protein
MHLCKYRNGSTTAPILEVDKLSLSEGEAQVYCDRSPVMESVCGPLSAPIICGCTTLGMFVITTKFLADEQFF